MDEPKLCIFNVKYSPNLGDGVIAASLEAQLARHLPDWEIGSIDLAGRTAFGHGLRSRGAVMSLLQRLPNTFREAVSIALLYGLAELKLRPAWRRALAGQHAAVIGGGQLIQGADLNFPIKIEAAMREVRRLGLPCIVYGVGVSNELSCSALALFRRAFDSALVDVYVRDAESKTAWDQHFACCRVPQAKLCWDPALTLDDGTTTRAGDEVTIGLGFTAPLVLAHHGTEHDGGLEAADAFWTALVPLLAARNYRLLCFTNGAEEDERYLDGLWPRLAASAGDAFLRRAPRLGRPEELVGLVSAIDGLVSHRLHANIIAFALGKPHVGLAWDRKLDSFFAAIGRAKFMAKAELASAARVACLVEEDLATGVNEAIRARVGEEARAGVREVAIRLSGGVGLQYEESARTAAF